MNDAPVDKRFVSQEKAGRIKAFHRCCERCPKEQLSDELEGRMQPNRDCVQKCREEHGLEPEME